MWNRIEDLENWCHHINMRMIGLKEGLEPGGMIKYVYNILSEGLGIDPDAGFEIERAHHVLTLRPDANHLLNTPCCHGPAGVPRLATRCLCVLSTWLVVCLVPCAPMSIVCPLPSCYLIIVSVAPAVSPSLPSFVSLYSLLVSAVLC